MRRIIEGLIRKRKEKQKDLTNILTEIGESLESRGGLFPRRIPVKEHFSRLDGILRDFILSQDREWDAYSNNHATGVFQSLQWKIEKLQAEYANLKSLLINFAELEGELNRIIDRLRKGRVTDQDTEALSRIRDQLSVTQYADFEQRFRGDEQQVREMLRGYLPFFRDRDHILDIGCGRGEFLSLLREAGIPDYLGIDVSDSMLKIATGHGLRCIKKEALEFLRESPEEKFGGVFSSQVIEHLSPAGLREIVMECFRVLQPGSPLILETINPLSLFALSRIFFLDVTHQKPLHPEYMRYLLETTGFSEVEILYSGEFKGERLQNLPAADEQSVVINCNIDKLNSLLYASPCYAVKGLKGTGKY